MMVAVILVVSQLFSNPTGEWSHSSLQSYAMTDTIIPGEEPLEVFKKVNIMPRFYNKECESLATNALKEECSKKALLDFIYENIVYPEEAIKNKIEGNAVVQFIVLKNGTVGNINIVRELGYGCGQASLDVIQLMNDENMFWIPGYSVNRAVNVLYTLPIKFKLSSLDRQATKKQGKKIKLGKVNILYD